MKSIVGATVSYGVCKLSPQQEEKYGTHIYVIFNNIL